MIFIGSISGLAPLRRAMLADGQTGAAFADMQNMPRLLDAFATTGGT